MYVDVRRYSEDPLFSDLTVLSFSVTASNYAAEDKKHPDLVELIVFRSLSQYGSGGRRSTLNHKNFVDIFVKPTNFDL